MKPTSIRLSPRLKTWLDAALAFFYPEVCQICGAEHATPDMGYVGATCRHQLRPVERPYCEHCGKPFEGAIAGCFDCSECQEMKPAYVYARSAVITGGLALEIIHRYKYQRALWFEPFLAGLLIDRAAIVLGQEKWDWIVPVPLHPLREREREFNQAERLGRRLSQAVGIPMRNGCLKRISDTPTQTRLTRAQRLDNVKRAFQIAPGTALAGQRIVLVDDVMTTGATTHACAETWRKAGGGDVCVWTVARGI